MHVSLAELRRGSPRRLWGCRVYRINHLFLPQLIFHARCPLGYIEAVRSLYPGEAGWGNKCNQDPQKKVLGIHRPLVVP